MKIKAKKILSILMAAITVFSALYVSSFANEEPVGFTDEDFLVTKGQDIVNRRGEKIQLKGVNLGSWLIWEDWLSPYEEATDHYDVLTKLTERFGVEGAYALMDTFMDSFSLTLDELK